VAGIKIKKEREYHIWKVGFKIFNLIGGTWVLSGVVHTYLNDKLIIILTTLIFFNLVFFHRKIGEWIIK